MEKRLQIDFSERAYNDLTELQKRLDAPSKSEVIRTALGVLRWLVDEHTTKNRILLQKPDGSTERVVFHFLDRLRLQDEPRSYETSRGNA